MTPNSGVSDMLEGVSDSFTRALRYLRPGNKQTPDVLSMFPKGIAIFARLAQDGNFPLTIFKVQVKGRHRGKENYPNFET
jgi:hypothetical protein